jgi:signal transduction histidine kinase
MRRWQQQEPAMAQHDPPLVSGPHTPLDERILILTPGGRNAAVLHSVLDTAGLGGQICDWVEQLIAEAERGAGVVLLTPERLSLAALGQIHAFLAQQPPWSALPLVALVAPPIVGTAAIPELAALQEHAAVTFLAQPVHSVTLVSTVQAALQARRRQYEVRDLQATLEQRVQARTAQLRAVAGELVLAERRERERIARLLHDDLQQRLYGIRLQLQMVTEEAEASAQTALIRYAQQAYAALGEAIGLTRHLTVTLSPPVLKDSGLVAALEWLATQMEAAYGFVVELQVAQAFAIGDEDLRVLLYESVQELLFNVVKHAQTNRATVAVWAGEAGQLVIQVSDAGQGFALATAEARHANGYGLFSVRERLGLFGGQMTIDTAPGQGTRITLAVPLGSPPANAR